MSGVLLPICSIFFSGVLLIVYFSKKRVNLIENKMRFIEWTPTDGDLYFDIAEKQHIPEKEFDEKYGDDTRYAIEMMYKDAKKAQRKAKRNQE